MKIEVSILVLLEREQDRLKKALSLLATYEASLDDLIKLQAKWKEELCFAQAALPLLAALDQLIQCREVEAYPRAAYDEVIYQINVYKNASKLQLHQAFGSDLAPYLNEWGHLRKQYRKQYKQLMEPLKKMSISMQADFVRSNLPGAVQVISQIQLSSQALPQPQDHRLLDQFEESVNQLLGLIDTARLGANQPPYKEPQQVRVN